MKKNLLIIVLLVFSYNLKINAQGGNNCVAALANPLVNNIAVTNQTTCGKFNDVFVGNNLLPSIYFNGQDYYYTYCATVDGCLKISLPNCSTGDPGKSAVACLSVYTACPTTTNCVSYDTVVLPPNGATSGPELNINLLAGQCVYILIDERDGGIAYADCINYDILANFSNVNSQTPGGNTCADAIANPLLLNTNYNNQTTCCAGNDNTNYVGNDWNYYFCAPADGCLTVNLGIPFSNNKPIKPYIGLYNGCPNNGGSLIVSQIDTTYSNNGISLRANVIAGTCYYLMVDGGNPNCINYSLYAEFFPSTPQLDGANTCALAAANPIVPNVLYAHQNTCCAGNDDILFQGNDWYYSYCPTQDECMQVTIDSISIIRSNHPDFHFFASIYEGCPNAGGVKKESAALFLTTPDLMSPLTYAIKPSTLFVEMKAGNCYYISLDADEPTTSCFQYNLKMQLQQPLVQNAGGNDTTTALLNAVSVDTTFYNQSTICAGNDDTSYNGQDWIYTYCAKKTGCVQATLNNIFVSNVPYEEYSANLTAFENNIADSNSIVSTSIAGANTTPVGSAYGYINFNVDSGKCYYVVIDNQRKKSFFSLMNDMGSVSVNYNLSFSFTDTAHYQPIGGNNCADAIAKPIFVNTLYTNQSTCCKGNHFKPYPAQDWYYYFCAPDSGCIFITTPNCYGDSNVSYPAISLFDSCPNIKTAIAYNAMSVQLGTTPKYGPEIKYPVDSGKCYFILVDGVTQTKTNPMSPPNLNCFNYDLKLDYVAGNFYQTIGGDSCYMALTKPIAMNTTYPNQTTCCAVNTTPGFNGQDWTYAFCPTDDGCVTINFNNLSSGVAGKSSALHVLISNKIDFDKDSLSIVSTFDNYGVQSVYVPKDTVLSLGSSFSFYVRTGRCYYIYVDGVQSSDTVSNCVNYDLQTIFTPTIIQSPGGNSCDSAMLHQLANDSTYYGQTTCCATNNSTYKIGEDWYYIYCAKQKGCLKVSLNNITATGLSANLHISAFLGVSTTCPDGNFNSFLTSNSVFQPFFSNVNNTTPNLANGPFVKINVDSGVCYYFMVDDLDSFYKATCIHYTLKTEFSAFALQTPGGNNCIQAASNIIKLDSIYSNQTTCCMGNEIVANNGQDWIYKFCTPKNGCVEINLDNVSSGDEGKGAIGVLKVFESCPDSSSAISLASTSFSMTQFGNITSNTISINAVAGHCYYIVVDNIVPNTNYSSCINYKLITHFTPIQNAGGNTCAAALANPIHLDSLYTNQTTCTPCIGNDYTGLNSCGSSFLYSGNDWLYAIVSPKTGMLKINMGNILNASIYSITITIGVYNACPGTSNACITYVTKTINPNSIDSIILSIPAYIGQTYYILVDGDVYNCITYSLQTSIYYNTLGCNNTDFETGNLNGWSPSIANSIQGCTACPCPSPYYSFPNYVFAVGRHTIVNSGVDPYGGFPKVFSGNYSLKLGNDSAGAQAEGIRQSFLVTPNNSRFNYSYAVVLQDPGHSPNTQPFFKARIKDSIGNTIQCTEYCVSASSAVTGFQNAVAPNVIYKPWSNVFVDLSNYIGSVVSVEFENGDCADGGHFGYSYIDCYCSTSPINTKDTLCPNTCDTLFAPLGNANYLWSTGDTTYYLKVCPTVSSTYTVSFLNSIGCTLHLPFSIYVIPDLQFTDSTNCKNGGSITVKTTGGFAPYQYTWNTTPVKTTTTIFNVQNGIYTVTISDSKCASKVHTINANVGYPTASITNIKTPTCYGLNNGSASLNATGGTGSTYGYHWLTTPNQNIQNASNLFAGNIKAYVIDSIGCADSISFILPQPDSIQITFNTKLACDTNLMDTISASVIGGTPPYTYSWNSIPTQTTNIALLKAGNYTLVVTDSLGCTKSKAINIPNGFYINTFISKKIKCFGDANGEIVANTYNGTAPFTYSWITTPIQNTATAINLSVGTYIVQITDANGCTKTTSISITQPNKITIKDSVLNTCNNTNNGKIYSIINGGVLPYQFAWNTVPVVTTANIFNLKAGSYLLTVTDSNGCIATKNIFIDSILVSYSNIVKTICSNQFYNGHNTNGIFIDTFINTLGCDSFCTLNLTVQPSNIYTTTTIACFGSTVLGHTISGTYIDSFKNSFGCDSIYILNLTILPKKVSTINKFICSNQTYNGHSTSGVYIDSFLSANGCDSIINLNLTVLNSYINLDTINVCIGEFYFAGGAWQNQTGLYIDSFKNFVGCDSIIKTYLQFYTALHPKILGKTEFCAGDTIQLIVNNFKNYIWNTGEVTNKIIVSNAGIYIVNVKNDSNCVGADTIKITKNNLPNIHINYTQKDLCILDTLHLNATGATDYFWFIGSLANFASTQNPFIYPIDKSPIKIYLKGVDDKQCVNYDSVTLYYINCCGTLFVPNAFSPNGDNINDHLEIKTNTAKFEEYSIKIYNRYGEKVFESTDINSSWNGNFKNKTCEMDTYYYIIRTKCFSSQDVKIIKGDVLLIK